MVGNIYKTNYDPDKIAINFKGESVTYAKLDEMVRKYANHLAELGVQKDDKVILSCMNSPEFIYSYFGTVRNGAVIVPINLMLTMEEIAYIVKNSDAKYMIIHPFIIQKANLTKEAIEAALGVTVIVLDEEFKKEVNVASTDEKSVDINEESISTFLYTSGTTGKQKAAMLTHKNLVDNTEQCSLEIDSVKEDRFMCVLPMFHVFAFTACILIPLRTGATVTIVETFQPKEVVETLIKGRITVFMGVPAMYNVLLNSAKNNIGFPDLRLAISGGAALPVEIYRQARDLLKLPVIEGYGLTEASPAVSFNPYSGIQKEGSIGKPIPYVECKIFDENDNEVETNVVGELVVKGSNVMKGYYKDPEQTEAALRNGWLHTGDLARMDEDGYIFIVDRKKDMVVVSGMNVYPREIEEVIYRYPKVKEATVVGVKDKTRGEAAKGFIVLKDGEECSSRELLRFLKEHLAAYKIPRHLEFIDELPKNSSGKIMKRMLVEKE